MLRLVGGALARSLPAQQLFVTAVILALWAVAVRLLLPSGLSRPYRIGLPLCILLLFAIACSYPGTRLIDWLAWPLALAPLAIVDCVSARRQHSAAMRPAMLGLRAASIDAAADGVESPTTLQQITRYRDANGRDAVVGKLTAEFSPGQREKTLHVAFCPPFETLPHVEAEIADDSAADLHPEQVLHNGAQLEVRLAKPAAVATTVAVEFFAAEAERF
jgi:hypothetical protein